MRASTIKDAFNLDMRAIDPAAKLFGSSPTAAEARHFISLTALKQRNAAARDYVVAWTFAVSTGLWGYTLELAAALKTHDDASSPHIKLLAQFMYDSVR